MCILHYCVVLILKQENNITTDSVERLRSMHKKYEAKFKTCLKQFCLDNVAQLVEAIRDISGPATTQNSVPEILAGVCAVWSIISTKPLRTSYDSMWKLHSAQVSIASYTNAAANCAPR